MPDSYLPTLTWPGAHSAGAWWNFIVVGVCVVLMLRLFRWERRLTTPGVGLMLLALRTATLIVVLLTLLQPTLAWVIDEKLSGRILVALDVSDSMTSGDAHATRRERLQWAQALGWIAPGQVKLPEDVPADDLAADRRIALDAAVEQQVFPRFDALTRLEIAHRALMDGNHSLWTNLTKLAPTELILAAGAARVIPPEELSADLSPPPADVLTTTTRLVEPLRLALSGESDRPILGIVLFTDGRDSDAKSTLALAESLGQNKVPVFPVLVGSTHRPKDVSIVSLEVPIAVYRGDHPQVRTVIGTTGYVGDRLEVTLDRVEPSPDFTPITRTIVAGDTPQTLDFELPTEQLGEHRYRVSLPTLPGESRPENNTREFALQVVDDRSRVLLVDEQARWEFRYLEAALSRDERVDLQVVLFEQPHLGVLAESFFPRIWPKSATPDESPFTGRDLVILGDLGANRLSSDQLRDLDRYVAETGGTLVLIAGRERMPMAVPAPVLRGLLPITAPFPTAAPVRADDTSPTLRGWTWSPTAEGLQQTSLQFATDAEANRALWNVLPGATWAIQGIPKPGATVWAWGQSAANPNQPAPTQVPLIVHQHYGLGQVLWLATDSTWRWRFRAGDQFHHRFWGQIARWAASSKLSAGNSFVQFGPVKPKYNLGEPVEFQARWSAKLLSQGDRDRSATVEIFEGDRLKTRVALRSDPSRPLISQGTAPALPPGEYRARLVAPQLELGPVPLEAPLTIVAPPSSELAELTANREFLQSVADASGGKLFELHELADLPKEFRPFQAVSSLPQERTLWDRWPTYMLLATLLTLEWILRRQNGLP